MFDTGTPRPALEAAMARDPERRLGRGRGSEALRQPG